MSVLLRFVNLLFTLYSLAIFARVLLPYLRVAPYHPVVIFLIRITDPLLVPLRRYIPPVSGLDFTPMVALLIIWLIEQLLRTLILSLG
jgi:YggT family protein